MLYKMAQIRHFLHKSALFCLLKFNTLISRKPKTVSAPRVIKQHIFPSLCIDPKIRDPLALITGLPEGIILYHDGSGLNPTVRYSPFASANSEDFEKITEHCTSLSNPETTDSIINEIPCIQSLVDYCEQEHGSLFPRTNTVAGSLRIPITRTIWQDTVMVGNCPTSPKGIPAALSTRNNMDVAAQCKSRANSNNFLRKNACF